MSDWDFCIESEPGRWLRFDEIDSTNRFLLEGSHPSGTVCVAVRQTAGRGRRGRNWQNAPGQSVLFSAVLIGPLEGSEARLRLAPLLVGLSLRAAVSEISRTHPVRPGEARLKWPNDIYWVSPDDRSGKLAGILLESRVLQTDGVRCLRLVMGVGLNWKGAPVEAPAAVDLFAIETEAPPGDELIACFAAELAARGDQNTGAWIAEFRRFDYLSDRAVRVGEKLYRASGIDATGALLLLDGAGGVLRLEDTQPDLEILPTTEFGKGNDWTLGRGQSGAKA